MLVLGFASFTLLFSNAKMLSGHILSFPTPNLGIFRTGGEFLHDFQGWVLEIRDAVSSLSKMKFRVPSSPISVQEIGGVIEKV